MMRAVGLLLSPWILSGCLAGSAQAASRREASNRADEIAGLLAKATAILEKGGAGEAIPVLKQADDLSQGGCVECLEALATAYYRSHRYDDVVRTARRVIALDPPVEKLANAYNQLALGQLGDGKPGPERLREAENAYRRGLELHSQLEPVLRYNLARLLLRTTPSEEATGLLRAIVTETPQSEMATRAHLLLEDPACVDEACAPDFTLALGERRVTRADLSGKVVLLYFFATDCYRCELSHPVLHRLALRVEKEPFFVAAVSEGRADALAAAARQLPVPLHDDQGARLAQAFGIRDRPARVLIDHRGRIVSVTRVLSPREERAQFADHRGQVARGAGMMMPQDDAKTVVEVNDAIRRARKAR